MENYFIRFNPDIDHANSNYNCGIFTHEQLEKMQRREKFMLLEKGYSSIVDSEELVTYIEKIDAESVQILMGLGITNFALLPNLMSELDICNGCEEHLDFCTCQLS